MAGVYLTEERRTRFEMYIDILEALSRKPMKITHIMHSVNVNGTRVREYVDFMLKQRLVEKEMLSEKRFNYRITTRGRKVLEIVDMVKNETPQEIWCELHR